MAIIEHKFEIGFRDVGKSNELTNRALIGFLEDIAGIHSTQVGFGLNTIAKTGVTWVLLNWKVKIFKRPIYGDIVSIKTWARDTAKFYTYRDFEVYNNNELVAIATTKWVLMDAKTMSLMKISDEVISPYEIETKKVFGDSPEPNKLIAPEEIISSLTYTIQRRDIDINGHVHNTYYLDIASEILPENIYNNFSFDTFEVMYKKEAKLGENMKCFYSKTDNSHYVVMKTEDEQHIHCIVKLDEKE